MLYFEKSFITYEATFQPMSLFKDKTYRNSEVQTLQILATIILTASTLNSNSYRVHYSGKC